MDPSLQRLPPPDPVYGTPTAATLLEAVRDFLHTEILDTQSGNTKYLLRVAINVVDIVRREIEQRDDATARLSDALAELGMADEVELAQAIRSGTFDDRADEIRRYLTTAVLTRLQVNNPRYAEVTETVRP